jgi:transposase
MGNNSINMSKLRQILKLFCSHHIGTRTISGTIGVSRNTVKKYVRQFQFLKTTWEELSELTDKELEDLFNEESPPELPEKLEKLIAYFPYAEKRLKQRGMTLHLLWKEYIEKHPCGYQSSGFYNHFKKWKCRSHPSMHMVHKAGDKMFVDYAGEKLQLTDTTTGELTDVEVFVAILGASQFTYVQAVASQDMEDFITCCENALYFFGGAPSAIVPDNLKSAVTKSSRYEPQLNENFEAFADHYGVSVLPARTYKPKDKALVEGAVKIAYNRIYTSLHGRIFTTLKELNDAIWELLEKHNGLKFQGRDYSRQEQFDEMEKLALQKLPDARFEMRKQVMITVMKNGHVCLHCDKHYYSVPYGFIGKKAKLLYSKSRVEVYYKYELIAAHDRIKSPHNYTTDPAHMATHNLYITDWNPDKFIKEAYEIHNDVGLFIEQVLLRKPHPEQAYKSCQGILSYAKRLGNKRLILACQRAHGYGLYHYKIIESILQKNLDQHDIEDTQNTMPQHDNIRGEGYYK